VHLSLPTLSESTGNATGREAEIARQARPAETYKAKKVKDEDWWGRSVCVGTPTAPLHALCHRDSALDRGD